MKKKEQVMTKKARGMKKFDRQHILVKAAALIVAAILVLSLAMPAFS